LIAGTIALASSALFAVSAVLALKALNGTSPLAVAFTTILVNAGILWIIALTIGGGPYFGASSAIFLVAGGLAPGLGRILFYRAVSLIGVGSSSVANNSTPIFVAVGAVAFLGEPITVGLALGTGAIVLGVITIARSDARSGSTVETTHGRPPRSVGSAGFAFAVAGAFVAAISMLVRKAALGLDVSPLVGAAWTMTGATLLLLPAVALRLTRTGWRFKRNVATVTLVSAGFSALATVSGFVALSLGEVSRVVPLQQTMPLFVAATLRLGFKDLEAVGARTAAGATLAVAGAALVISGL